jgi:putative ATP-dependent endonuclease of OLD family
MFISRIFIKNFRNFRHLDISLDDGVTCFIGENNIGKTNLFYALRLVLDSGLSGFRRKLRPEDFACGLSIDAPEQVIVAVEFGDFANKPNEQALHFKALMPGQQRARPTFRFRPRTPIREMRQNMIGPLRRLKIDDYDYELAGGGGADLSNVQWHENFGRSFFNDDFQQGFHLVSMEALRDVELGCHSAVAMRCMA